MARIRSIKPEFWTSEQVADCSPTARLLFVGLWSFSDDAGIHPASAKRVKMEVFPGDSFTEDEIASWIDELIAAGLVIEFSYDNQRFWSVTGWKHQKIEKPNFRYPSPTSEGSVIERSANGRRTVVDSSPPDRRDRRGEEGNGGEGVQREGRPSTPNGRKRSPKTAAPPEFVITDPLRTWAAEHAPGIDLDRETQRFLDRNRAKGERYSDWNAAWRNWMSKALEFKTRDSGNADARLDDGRPEWMGRYEGPRQ